MDYFIADPHFGHDRIIEMCGRPFKSVEEMDETMIENWNKAVSDEDDVYIIGDFAFRCNPEKYLIRLQGRKHLIIGNHDESWLNRTEPSYYFESVDYMAVITTDMGRVTLCHYPMMDYDTPFQIYGHIHNHTGNRYFPFLTEMRNSLNAGVEINHYRPVTIEELIAHNRSFKLNLKRRIK